MLIPSHRFGKQLAVVNGGAERRAPTQVNEIRGVGERTDRGWFLYVDFADSNQTYSVPPVTEALEELVQGWIERRRRHLRRLVSLAEVQRAKVKQRNAWALAGSECNPMPGVVLLEHANQQYNQHLGDCWLVRFKRSGRTAYLPSSMLYLEQVNGV